MLVSMGLCAFACAPQLSISSSAELYLNTDPENTMPLDHYITLGRSGLRVSPFCLGAMTFGEDFGWGASAEDSEAMLAAYLERGGNFIDTANVYTNGHSEKIVGDFFAKSDARRDRVVICTRFF